MLYIAEYNYMGQNIEDFTKITFHESFLLSGVCTIINVHPMRTFIPVLL